MSPAIPISEVAKYFLAKEKALKYLKDTPESLGKKDLNSYDLIAAMEYRHKDVVVDRCPQCETKIVVWNIDDP